MNVTSTRSYQILRALITKEFKIRYKHTALGFVWSLLNPILFALVFFVAFGHILRVRTENFLVFLLAGLFPWQWFASSVNTSPNVFFANASLVKKVYVPRLLIPLAQIGNHLIHFLLALIVATSIFAFFGSYPSLMWLLGIPTLLIIQFSIILGFSLTIASLNVLFRDLEYVTTVLTSFMFYLTPILYPRDVIPERYLVIFHMNPMYYVIPAWRNLMLHGTVNWNLLGSGALYGAVILAVGVGIYKRMEGRIAECI